MERPISLSYRRTIFPAPLRISINSNRASSFTRAPSSWTQTLPSPLRATRNWKAGSCIHSTAVPNDVKKRARLQLALGCSYYYGDNNYEAALNEFQIAQRGLPNESEMYLYTGAIQRRLGRWA